ncbi:hypothetical protein ACKLNO_04405 [Neisseriaceae bacterium B1]
MLTLNLPSHIEQTIIQTAQKQGVSMSDLIVDIFKKHHATESAIYP